MYAHVPIAAIAVNPRHWWVLLQGLHTYAWSRLQIRTSCLNQFIPVALGTVVEGDVTEASLYVFHYDLPSGLATRGDMHLDPI